MDAVAVTDHGNMFGAYELQTSALEAGIKPILGVEAYIAPGSRFDRESTRTFDGEGNNYHLTLLVETPDGYRNLARLVSEAFLSGFYYKPRMDWELLERYHEGIIALSGCLNSEVSKRLRMGDYEGAKKTALRYRDLFGKDRYFIEIMDHGLPEQRQILPDLLRLSSETGIPPVATNDAHYLTRDDAGGTRRPAVHRDGKDAQRREADEVLQLGVLREGPRGDERRVPPAHARGREEHRRHRRAHHAQRHRGHGAQDPDVPRPRRRPDAGGVSRGPREGGAGAAARTSARGVRERHREEAAAGVRRAAGRGSSPSSARWASRATS